MGAHYGLQPSDISIRSLCASGALALLCARVDTDLICLLGRWGSNEMPRYPPIHSYPIIHLSPPPLAARMLQQGHFTLIPNNTLIGG
jgi:hypothetical protein